jgi:hypothetical protein
MERSGPAGLELEEPRTRADAERFDDFFSGMRILLQKPFSQQTYHNSCHHTVDMLLVDRFGDIRKGILYGETDGNAVGEAV